LQEILAGNFQIPSQEEMETFIRDNFCEPFDEYKERTKIWKLHPEWSEVEISDELERQERAQERESRTKIRWFSKRTKDILTSAFNLNKHVFSEITHFAQPKVQHHPNSNFSFDE
jgi:hypothetical protein